MLRGIFLKFLEILVRAWKQPSTALSFPVQYDLQKIYVSIVKNTWIAKVKHWVTSLFGLVFRWVWRLIPKTNLTAKFWTALCWIVWHNVHSQQHTYMSSSYRSNRLSLSHWDPYDVLRGGCLELYYCSTMECFRWDSSLISRPAALIVPTPRS